jgi:cytosine/uracil/thiamine/allantoin permease
MWKIAVGFVIFAGLAVWMLSKGGDIDMSGEKHGSEATHASTEAASAAVPASAAK